MEESLRTKIGCKKIKPRRKRMVKIKTFLMAAGLLFVAACSKEDGDIQTKDVSFLFPVRCDELHVSDIYAGEVTRSVHLTDVDTVTVRFTAMEYGNHDIVVTADGNTTSIPFTVSGSTQSMYEINTQTISVVVNDTWDGEIIYHFYEDGYVDE